jgi:hypothetical protein
MLTEVIPPKIPRTLVTIGKNSETSTTKPKNEKVIIKFALFVIYCYPVIIKYIMLLNGIKLVTQLAIMTTNRARHAAI